MKEQIFKTNSQDDKDRIARTIELLKLKSKKVIPDNYQCVKDYIKKYNIPNNLTRFHKFHSECKLIGKYLYAHTSTLEMLKNNPDYFRK